MKRYQWAVALGCVCCAFAPVASANLLSNWSFEPAGYADWQNPGGISGWTFWEDYPYDGDGAANGAPWAVHAGALSAHSSVAGVDDPVPDGNYCLAIGAEYGTWRAFMYQEVSVIPGRWYSLAGWGANGGEWEGAGAAFWAIDGTWQGIDSPGEPRAGGPNGPVGGTLVWSKIQQPPDKSWEAFGCYVKATGSVLTVAAESWSWETGGPRMGCFDALVMELTDIPEPGTLALLATGLASLGAIRKR